MRSWRGQEGGIGEVRKATVEETIARLRFHDLAARHSPLD
jgi:hypothetical protein